VRRLITPLFGVLFAVALFAGPLPAATNRLHPAIATSRSPSAPRTGVIVRHRAPRPAPFPGAAGRTLQVVSVVATSSRARTARVTLWQRRAPGARWRRASPAAVAHVGADGLTRHPHEGRAATPLGSFALTRAFGRDADVGARITRMPYRQLRPGDGWSNARGHYNRLGRTGEMFLGRDSWMRLAVLIDYNTVHPRYGAGSGFFLHVGGTSPTDGCVGLPLPTMRRMLAWLRPAARPRVVIALAPR
jgi:L,D-peptidoglycan transpeptidase YkuD (ErfK/YbiS/YcfS/YnhG family)